MYLRDECGRSSLPIGAMPDWNENAQIHDKAINALEVLAFCGTTDATPTKARHKVQVAEATMTSGRRPNSSEVTNEPRFAAIPITLSICQCFTQRWREDTDETIKLARNGSSRPAREKKSCNISINRAG